MKLPKIIGLGLLLIIVVCSLLVVFHPAVRFIAMAWYINTQTITEFTVDGHLLYMNNEMNRQTPKQLENILREYPDITTIVLQHVPGSWNDEILLPMGRMVRNRGLHTHLQADSIIASGGVDFFLAGNKRSMEYGAEIGVHSWHDGNKDGKEYPQDAPEHDMYTNYTKDMLGSDAFYWFTIYQAPFDGIYMMSIDEIINLKLLTEPVQYP